MRYKVGFSKDIHILKSKSNSKLLLGNYSFNTDWKVEASSDGDIVLHSLAEAILGALGMDDIGTYFSPKNSINRNLKSIRILNFALNKLKKNCWKISNIDILIQVDNFRIEKIKNNIKSSLAKTLNISEKLIAIKATSSENTLKNVLICYANVMIRKSSILFI